MSFTDIFIRRPILALVVSLLILLMGAAAVFSLPVRQYPYLENATVTVTTSFPGATQEVMQGFVTTPISQSIATASGIEYLSSTTTQGKSEIKARLVLNADADRAMTEILAKVQQVKYQLPAGVTDPVISKSTEGGTAVQYVAFFSDTLTIPQITDFANRVAQPLFAGIPGVASVDINGGQTLALRIWIDPVKLAARGLSAGEVAAALRANNVQAAPGQLKSSLTVTNISAATDLRDVEDFRQMVILSKPDGGVVRLSDVATVEIGGQNYNNASFASGVPAIFVSLYPSPEGNPLEIVKQAKALVPKIREMAPPGLSVMPNYDVAKFVNASIEEVRETLVEAVVIVIAVIFLFLGTFRAVIIPVVTIPLSLIGTAALMLAFGFSINLLTLLAMVLAIGLVVDDAIVVVENIHRHVEDGLSSVRAALLGAREIVGPVIAMTITLAAVYAPIGMMGGLTGALFKEFAFTLAGSVVVSGVVALTLSPVMSSMLLDARQNEGRLARLVEHYMASLAERYRRALSRTLARAARCCWWAWRCWPPSWCCCWASAASSRPRKTRARSSSSPRRRSTRGGLYRALRRPGRADLRIHPRVRQQLHAYRRHRTRAEPDAERGDPEGLVRALALVHPDPGPDTGGRRRDRRRNADRRAVPGAAGLQRRPAGADGAALAGGLQDAL